MSLDLKSAILSVRTAPETRHASAGWHPPRPVQFAPAQGTPAFAGVTDTVGVNPIEPRSNSHSAVKRCALHQDDDLGAFFDAFIKVDDVLVHHADAARRHAQADRPGLRGAVDAVDGVLAVLVE